MLIESYHIYANEVMSTDFILVKDNINIDEILSILVKSKKEEIFMVNDSNQLIVIIILKDLYEIYNYLDESEYDFNIDKYIYKDIIYGKPTDTLLNCRNIMLVKDIGRLPILDGGQIVGVIRQDHIRDYLYMGIEQTSFILKYILDNIQEAVCVVDKEGKVV